MQETKRVIQIKGPFRFLEGANCGFSTQEISSKNSLIDADIVIIDTKDIESIYNTKSIIEVGKKYDEQILKKRKHLIDHLKRGKDIIVFLNGKNSLHLLEQDNYIKANEEFFFSHEKDLIKEDISGINIVSCNDEILNHQLLIYDSAKLFKYNYSINSRVVDIPLMKIRNSNEVVSGVKYLEKGRIFYLPSINFEQQTIFDVSTELGLANSIISLVLSLVLPNSGKEDNISIPKWLKDKKLLDEQVIIDKIETLNEGIDELQKEKEDLEYRGRQINYFKTSLITTGIRLESIVKDILEYMGFTFIPLSDTNRVDIVIKFENKYIVCEVKGVKGTAKESYAAQLEKWSTEFYYEKSVISKGLMIIATHINTPLDKRIKTDFPDQMLRYMKMKSQSGITTVTLLEILEKFENGQITTEEIFYKFYEGPEIIRCVD